MSNPIALFLLNFMVTKLKIDFTNFLHLYFSKQTLSDRCFEPQQQQELSNPHRILLLILRGGRRALETSHRRPSTRCAALDCGLLLRTQRSTVTMIQLILRLNLSSNLQSNSVSSQHLGQSSQQLLPEAMYSAGVP